MEKTFEISLFDFELLLLYIVPSSSPEPTTTWPRTTVQIVWLQCDSTISLPGFKRNHSNVLHTTSFYWFKQISFGVSEWVHLNILCRNVFSLFVLKALHLQRTAPQVKYNLLDRGFLHFPLQVSQKHLELQYVGGKGDSN